MEGEIPQNFLTNTPLKKKKKKWNTPFPSPPPPFFFLFISLFLSFFLRGKFRPKEKKKVLKE